MLQKKPVGRNAAAMKYDIISALGAFALAQDRTRQRRILRLITLMTARYNWARDELAVGQREIARLWACDERTVKREMARLRADGWLVVRRQGARGRVSEYSLNRDQILLDTRPIWPAIGPDFVLRLDGAEPGGDVVPLGATVNVAAPDMSEGTEWALARGVLHREDAAAFGSWMQALTRVTREGGRLSLRAPSRFHAAYVQTHLLGRITAACRAVDDGVSAVVIVT